jgi:hypothetical protein
MGGFVMTKEEMIELAKQAGFVDYELDDGTTNAFDVRYEAFAKLVAEHERESWQEPVAWISTGTARMIHWTADKPAYGDDWVPLYTAPPQRKPLTDEDVERIVREARVGEHGIGYTIARAIEAAHDIKE